MSYGGVYVLLCYTYHTGEDFLPDPSSNTVPHLHGASKVSVALGAQYIAVFDLKRKPDLIVWSLEEPKGFKFGMDSVSECIHSSFVAKLAVVRILSENRDA